MNNQSPKGNRIAKVLSRSGVASRRDAEKIVLEGRVKVNGEILTSPAFNVSESDIILIDDNPIAKPEDDRLWCFHKPVGAITTARDDKNRKTIYDYFPSSLPRMMPIGRLDINSEGLLLLTNSGELKRKLELPSSQLGRIYRVRVKGQPKESDLDLLRSGISVENCGPETTGGIAYPQVLESNWVDDYFWSPNLPHVAERTTVTSKVSAPASLNALIAASSAWSSTSSDC